jgi:two-component system chemotaxis response regulator CheY
MRRRRSYREGDMAKCMIVDDSLFQRKSLSRLVTQLGWEVASEASNGREAVELYRRQRPDLVLMDLLMPEMEGTDAVGKIIEHDRNAKIVIVSSLGYDEIVDKAISLGAKQFITKPVDFREAADKLIAVLEEQ